MKDALTASLATLALLAPSAHASLGGPPTSVEKDNKSYQGELRITRLDDYDVSEITVDGTKVREYSLPGGDVFAVSWRGIGQPDLKVLFGKYYDEYASSVETENPLRRGPAELRSKHIIVQKFGHMRDVRGKAWVPSLLPRGFRVEEIK